MRAEAVSRRPRRPRHPCTSRTSSTPKSPSSSAESCPPCAGEGGGGRRRASAGGGGREGPGNTYAVAGPSRADGGADGGRRGQGRQQQADDHLHGAATRRGCRPRWGTAGEVADARRGWGAPKRASSQTREPADDGGESEESERLRGGRRGKGTTRAVYDEWVGRGEAYCLGPAMPEPGSHRYLSRYRGGRGGRWRDRHGRPLTAVAGEGEARFSAVREGSREETRRDGRGRGPAPGLRRPRHRYRAPAVFMHDGARAPGMFALVGPRARPNGRARTRPRRCIDNYAGRKEGGGQQGRRPHPLPPSYMGAKKKPDGPSQGNGAGPRRHALALG